MQTPGERLRGSKKNGRMRSRCRYRHNAHRGPTAQRGSTWGLNPQFVVVEWTHRMTMALISMEASILPPNPKPNGHPPASRRSWATSQLGSGHKGKTGRRAGHPCGIGAPTSRRADGCLMLVVRQKRTTQHKHGPQLCTPPYPPSAPPTIQHRGVGGWGREGVS